MERVSRAEGVVHKVPDNLKTAPGCPTRGIAEKERPDNLGKASYVT